MILGLEIFLDEVPSAAGEEHAAARGRGLARRPLERAVAPPVGRLPLPEYRTGGDGAAVEHIAGHGAGYGFESCSV